ncbi:hypothetical protein RclHR1_05060019 [Rhizophagus clarus]|uniref:Uncharacterized protein n=1 Tax=Rhizophagus clarus TaxID=94130 RepID=A0A2Z6RKM8_9GLOM|nr:hypothetical protein RclHR1_05060019 [Rhizophagus clarus]
MRTDAVNFCSSTVIPGIPPLIIAVLPSDQKETSTNVFQENNLVIKHLNNVGAKLIGLYFDGVSHDQNWLSKTYCNNSELQSELGLTEESESILVKKFPLNLHLLENKSPLLSGTDFYHCIKKAISEHAEKHNDDTYYGDAIAIQENMEFHAYEDIPLYPWLILTAFLEHIFGYTCQLIEDFTLLDFLMMNEKIIKNIEIKIKGSIKRPDSNDGYNIYFGSIKESLDPRLVLFPTEFEIGNTMKKVSTAMHGILKTIGIDFSSYEYIQIIRECFNSIHFENEHSNEEGAETENFDEYTLKKTQKFNPTLLQTSQNFVINTSDRSLNLEAALRIERMNAAKKSTF